MSPNKEDRNFLKAPYTFQPGEPKEEARKPFPWWLWFLTGWITHQAFVGIRALMGGT